MSGVDDGPADIGRDRENETLNMEIIRRAKKMSLGAHLAAEGLPTVAVDDKGKLVYDEPDASGGESPE